MPLLSGKRQDIGIAEVSRRGPYAFYLLPRANRRHSEAESPLHTQNGELSRRFDGILHQRRQQAGRRHRAAKQAEHTFSLNVASCQYFSIEILLARPRGIEPLFFAVKERYLPLWRTSLDAPGRSGCLCGRAKSSLTVHRQPVTSFPYVFRTRDRPCLGPSAMPRSTRARRALNCPSAANPTGRQCRADAASATVRGAKGGTWIARLRTAEGRQIYDALGAADDARDADGLTVFSFAEAQERARKFFLDKAANSPAARLPTIGPIPSNAHSPTTSSRESSAAPRASAPIATPPTRASFRSSATSSCPS